MSRFSLDDVAPRPDPATSETDRVLCTAYLSLHESKVGGLQQLCNRLPAPGELMMLWTLKQFNFHLYHRGIEIWATRGDCQQVERTDYGADYIS